MLSYLLWRRSTLFNQEGGLQKNCTIPTQIKCRFCVECLIVAFEAILPYILPFSVPARCRLRAPNSVMRTFGGGGGNTGEGGEFDEGSYCVSGVGGLVCGLEQLHRASVRGGRGKC